MRPSVVFHQGLYLVQDAVIVYLLIFFDRQIHHFYSPRTWILVSRSSYHFRLDKFDPEWVSSLLFIFPNALMQVRKPNTVEVIRGEGARISVSSWWNWFCGWPLPEAPIHVELSLKWGTSHAATLLRLQHLRCCTVSYSSNANIGTTINGTKVNLRLSLYRTGNYFKYFWIQQL